MKPNKGKDHLDMLNLFSRKKINFFYKLTHCQIESVDWLGLQNGRLRVVCSCLGDMTLIRSNLSKCRLHYIQRQLTIPHVCMQQIYATQRRWLLSVWIRRIALVKKYIFWIQVRPGPHHSPNWYIIWNVTWQNDIISRKNLEGCGVWKREKNTTQTSKLELQLIPNKPEYTACWILIQLLRITWGETFRENRLPTTQIEIKYKFKPFTCKNPLDQVTLENMSPSLKQKLPVQLFLYTCYIAGKNPWNVWFQQPPVQSF